MEFNTISTLSLGLAESLSTMPGGLVIAGALLALATATFTALSIPGTIPSMSFTGGMLLGLSGVFVIALGAGLGSVALFLVTRHLLGERIRARLGDRLDGIAHHLARRGPIYVVGARLSGVPGLAVTAASAAAPISARTFAAASLLGMLPAIIIASLAGSAL